MKRRFYVTLVVLALIFLALPGLTAKAIRRQSGPRLRTA